MSMPVPPMMPVAPVGMIPSMPVPPSHGDMDYRMMPGNVSAMFGGQPFSGPAPSFGGQSQMPRPTGIPGGPSLAGLNLLRHGATDEQERVSYKFFTFLLNGAEKKMISI